MGVFIRSARSLKRFFRFHKARGKKIKPPEKTPPLEFLWQSPAALLS
jgi:hypothetical protein